MHDDARSYHSGGDRDKQRLRALLDDDNLSLAQAYAEINRRHFAGRAAASTVEALMFGLRKRETPALTEAPVRQRLGLLSEKQLHEVCARLQKLKPENAAPWSVGEIELLLQAWTDGHG